MNDSSRSAAAASPRRRRSRPQSGRQPDHRRAGPPRSGRRRTAKPATNAPAGRAAQPVAEQALHLVEPEPVTGWRQLGSGKHLAIVVVIVFLVATIAGLAPPGQWYETLNKPAWTPPNWLFGPAWTVLYLMIAIAGWIIFTHATTATTKILWSAQLVVNAAWSLLFFGAHQMGLALIDVIAMSALALALIVVLLRDVFPWSRLAALLLIPYWLWVTFAAALNASIWLRNPVI